MPFVVRCRPTDAAVPLALDDASSISEASIARTSGRHGVCDRTNALVLGHGRWRTHRAEPVVRRPAIRVAIIGPVDTDRWREDGIL